ncbi:MAG: hypothetical protein WA822_14285 [Albidovulum sp.]
MQKTLYIHCGLHKTGSTSAQVQLAGLHDRLRDTGVLLHMPGGTRVAHHQHANCFYASKRYARKQALLDALASDIRAFPGHSVLISSEDFETSLADPEALARMKDFAQSAGARPVFLVYLRNPIDYFESLYLQMLMHGQPFDADELLERVLQDGCYAYRKWIFHFDYAHIASSVEHVGGLIVRNYHTLVGGSSTYDILDAIGHPVDAEPATEQRRIGARRKNANVWRFLTNRDRTQRPTKRWLRPVDRIMADYPLSLSLGARARMLDRFQNPVAEIDQKYGIGLSEVMAKPAKTGPRAALERIFTDANAQHLMKAWSADSDTIPDDLLEGFRADWIVDTAEESPASPTSPGTS